MDNNIERRVRLDDFIKSTFPCQVLNNDKIQRFFCDSGVRSLDLSSFLPRPYTCNNRMPMLEEDIKNMCSDETAATCVLLLS